MAYKVEITEILSLTHDVKHIKTTKPKDYTFTPGQATEVAIDKPGLEEKKRPFTFTSLPEEKHLAFTIKCYHDHNGVTDEVDNLVSGDSLFIGDAWGAIEYNGPGVFIAGGAGVTPFISILKHLESKGQLKNQRLLFSNKTGKDVIMEADFQDMLGERFISTLSKEHVDGHDYGRINMDFLKKHIQDFTQHFYICGPGEMVKDIAELLDKLGASTDALVFEK